MSHHTKPEPLTAQLDNGITYALAMQKVDQLDNF